MTDSALDPFHPLVRAWFHERFPNGPTRPQSAAWPAIADGHDVLVASPTGSGKTLTAFMVGINELFVNPPDEIPTGPSILYLSPLRALATDIKFNLQQPLEELAALAQAQGLNIPTIRAAVRTGDTSQSERQQHIRKPPHIYVTTPESLYNLLTSANGRNLMRHVRTVIVDEIHAMAPDKRGSHLSLSLERLERLTVETSGRRPQRIGLSATQRPLERVARFLTGVHDDGRDVRILDCTGYRQTDFALTLPNSELEAVMSTEQFHDVLGQLCDLVAAHTTTLIFVQSRRLAERFAHQLSEALLDAGLMANADQVVAAHHGSMSHERRHHVEHLLRSGQLRALVATASLELGIDVGPVDLVVQVGSPRAIATFLQRAGRANHQVGGVPKAR
ncbi:MAG: DEAD/DEAH box helicase, partial [Actinobacteria bacterium]|nr:DEAD/DEAH box helicase [Actinomycetota bacterium]